MTEPRMKTWSCKVGEVDDERLPQGADFPMRQAIREVYRRLTGEEPRFIFSGWGGELDEFERELVEATGLDSQTVRFE